MPGGVFLKLSLWFHNVVPRIRFIRLILLALLAIFLLQVFYHSLIWQSQSSIINIKSVLSTSTRWRAKQRFYSHIPTGPWPLDDDGCHVSLARAHLRLARAESMSINLDTFAEYFKSYFSFDHNASDWASLSGSGVWLNKQQTYVISTRMILKTKDCKDPCSIPLESFVYLQARDANFQPTNLRYETSSGIIIIPKEGRIAEIYNLSLREIMRGPEDARMNLDDQDNIMLTFNMEDHAGRHYYSYNLTNNRMQYLIPDKDRDRSQKNWAPFFYDHAMHFVYSFDPFRVLRCDRRGIACTSVVGAESGVSALRGGTPFMRYNNSNYLVGLARTMQECRCGRTYRPHVVIVYAPLNKPELMDLVYVSEDFDFDRVPFKPPFAPPNVGDHCDSFLIPCGFLRWDLGNATVKDTSYFTFSIQDSANLLIVVEGLESLVQEVIGSTEILRDRYKRENIPWGSIGPELIECAKKRNAAKCL